MRLLTGIGLAAVFGLVVVLTTARAEEKEESVALDKVPKAVIDAVKAKFAGVTITEASKEEEDGKTFYELALTFQGHKLDVLAQSDGKIVEVERQIETGDLPKPVAVSVKAKYPKGSIKKAEEVTKGTVTSFEVIIGTGDREEREIVLDPQGKILEDAEVDKD
jgi:Putative beta-lactamase-inhibitor-like, PepSY-like